MEIITRKAGEFVKLKIKTQGEETIDLGFLNKEEIRDLITELYDTIYYLFFYLQQL